MNNFEIENIKLLNLVDFGISGRIILKIIDNCTDHYINEEDIRKRIMYYPTCKKIIKKFKTLDRSYFSVYCLLKFGVNMIFLEKIRNSFKTLNELSKNLKILTNLHLQSKIEEKIIEALISLKLYYSLDLGKELLNEISANEPYLNNQLKEKILNKYPALSVSDYDETIDELIKNNKIIQSIDGLKIKKNLLSDYLLKTQDSRTDIVVYKLQGETLQQIADQKGVTKERIRQIIRNKIKKFPIFFNEDKYYKIMNLYDLSNKEFELLGFDDKYLIEYVKIKYKLSPSKNLLDYIADFNISGTEQIRKILKNNKLLLIDGDLVREDFIQLMKKYIQKNSIFSFSLEEIKDSFNDFLKKHYVDNDDLFIKNSKDIILKNRKLDNDNFFLSVGNQIFFVYRPDSLSSDFVESLDDFFNEFYGYGSVSLFFDNNISLCAKNHIFNERELFALSKVLLGEKYIDKIEFVRNPTFATKGINKEVFIENLILDMELPCRVDDYLNYVNKVTGLKKDTIYGQYSKMINQYKNSLGLITLDNEVSNEQYDYVKTIIGDSKCIGYSYLFDKVELRYGLGAQIILNNNNLRRIGYVKTNTSIYSNSYSNRLSAVIDAIDKLDEFMITENELRKISNFEYYYYRTYDFIDSNTLVKINKNSYLNIRKRNQTSLIWKFKEDLLKMIKDNEVYVLKKFIESNDLKNIIAENDELKDLFLSFDAQEFIKNIILSLREINYIETSTTFIFSRKELSINIIIDDILNEYGSLSLYDLKEALFDEYNLQKDITNSELSDMGYYCPKSSEKVYLTKEFYEKELEEYLNGNS